MGSYNAAKAGDRLREVTCRCGTLLVRETAIDAWRCPTPSCAVKRVGRLVVLGPRATIPRAA